jgi:hypothetical protein
MENITTQGVSIPRLGFDELPFCLWRRQRQRYENPSLRLFEPTNNSVGMSIPTSDHGGN